MFIIWLIPFKNCFSLLQNNSKENITFNQPSLGHDTQKNAVIMKLVILEIP